MHLSCSCPRYTASPGLLMTLNLLRIQPIRTPEVIRVVYEGPDRELGETIVRLFAAEQDSDITVYYDKNERSKLERRTLRKINRAERNDKLHGH